MSLLKKSFYQGIIRVFALPRLSIPLILTLGLTLGAVLSVIAISSTLMYQPLQGVKNESQLQAFEYRMKMSETLSVSYWNMNRLVAFAEKFSDLGEWAGITNSEQDIELNDTTFATTRFDASSNILSVLGSKLLLGEDTTIDSPADYVWISASLWQQGFSGLKSTIGKQITIANKTYIIAGIIEDVMAVRSRQTILAQQVWFIRNLTEVKAQTDNVGNISNEIDFLLLKSKDGQAQLPSKAQTDEWLIEYIKANVTGDRVQMFIDFLSETKKEVIVSNYRDSLLGETGALIKALFAAVIGLLLMATLNLLNLFIAHYQGRTKEFAIQITLGASLFKLRLLVLLENLPSFLLAAITGLLVTGWALKSLPLIAGDNFPMIDAIAIDSSTIIAALVIILVLSMIFSTLALVDIDKNALANNLNSSGKGVQAQSNQWLSRVLMVFQLAIASLLLTASVMIAMQSYQAVNQDLGYELGNSYNVTLSISDEEYITQINDFEDYGKSETNQLLNDVGALIEKQVTDSQVIINDYGPLSDTLQVQAFRNENNDGQRVIYQSRSLSSNFFSTFNIAMLAGSNLTQAQIDNDENRVVIDESMAKTMYPALSYPEIIGKEMRLSPDPEADKVIITGIVSDTISQTGITDPLALPAVYSHRIRVGGILQFTVLLPPGKSMTAAMLESELKRQFPRLTNLQVGSLDDIWQRQTLNQRVSLTVVMAMTALTLLLAAIGVAGLTQMTTNHRKYELAVRMATGASQSRLVNFILKDALVMLIIGLGLGFVVSVFVYQQIQQQLEMLPAFNWLTMSLLDSGLLIIVLLSVMIPAWRVIRADPMQALREE